MVFFHLAFLSSCLSLQESQEEKLQQRDRPERDNHEELVVGVKKEPIFSFSLLSFSSENRLDKKKKQDSCHRWTIALALSLWLPFSLVSIGKSIIVTFRN